MQAQIRKFFDNFADRIAFLRAKRGLTLGELADGSASTAKSWEQGSLPRADQWEAIARRLGVSVSLLFTGRPVSREDFDFVAKFSDEIGAAPVAPAGEDPAGYAGARAASSTPALEVEARELLEAALRAAGGRAERLGWIVEQLRAHVRTPAHWLLTDAERQATAAEYARLNAAASADPAAKRQRTG